MVRPQLYEFCTNSHLENNEPGVTLAEKSRTFLDLRPKKHQREVPFSTGLLNKQWT